MIKQVSNQEITEEEILKYKPLVSNIALYFFRLNKSRNVCFQDLLQTGWVGFMTGVRKFDPEKGCTLGAYCRSWAWGAIYRSILGSRAIKNSKLIIGHPLEGFEYSESEEYDILEFCESLKEPMKTIVNYSAQGHRPKEIGKLLNIDRKTVIENLEAFSTLLSLN